MTISRLYLDLAAPAVQSVLQNPYAIHQAVLRSFPEDAGDSIRVLFRVEPEVSDGVGTLLVQSNLEPDWSLPRFLKGLPMLEARAKPFEPVLASGMTLHFRLRGNPTVRRAGKRLGLVGEAAQADWLQRKLETGGFEVAAISVVDEGTVRARRVGGGDRHAQMVFRSVRFEGALQVVDPARATAILQQGVGPAKAFGFGLLSLARV